MSLVIMFTLIQMKMYVFYYNDLTTDLMEFLSSKESLLVTEVP